MIAFITGVLSQKSPTSVVVEVHGIGYQVFVPLSTFYLLPEEKKGVALHIYTHVREDALQLYGFLSVIEKKLFLLFLGISGVGPKLALNILSGMELTDLIQALREGSIERLRAIPGVGPKTAGRLVLELKEKVASLNLIGLQATAKRWEGEEKTKEDALSALTNLGYNQGEARRAIDQILKEDASSGTGTSDSVEELIKKALKKFAKVG